MSDSKQEETFKVIDRRHFTGEGEVRPEAAELDRKEQEAARKARCCGSEGCTEAGAGCC